MIKVRSHFNCYLLAHAQGKIVIAKSKVERAGSLHEALDNERNRLIELALRFEDRGDKELSLNVWSEVDTIAHMMATLV